MTEGPKRTVPEWRVEADCISPTDWHVYAADGTHIAQGIFSKDRAALIVAACNACQQINQQNPQAVAQSLSKAVTAMKYAIAELPDDESCDCCGDPLCQDYLACWKCAIRAALASIETQETP